MKKVWIFLLTFHHIFTKNYEPKSIEVVLTSAPINKGFNRLTHQNRLYTVVSSVSKYFRKCASTDSPSGPNCIDPTLFLILPI